MIKNVIATASSKKGKVYATDSKGNALFPQTPAIAEQLKAGCYANVIERVRTQGTDDNGALVPLEHPVTELIVTGVFADRTAAIAAHSEEAVFEMESKAYAASQVAQLSKKYDLDPKALAATI